MIFQFRSPRPSSAFRGDNPSVVMCRRWIMENHGEGKVKREPSFRPVRIFPAIRSRKRDFERTGLRLISFGRYSILEVSKIGNEEVKKIEIE